MKITPTAIWPDHRRPLASGGRLLAVPGAAEDRWADQLCDHQRDQHGAPRSTPGTSPSSGRPTTTAWATIVAYHSSLLHVVVLHRIIAIHGGHYVFKGDNNNFVDPTHPTRSQLVGALWVHIPHGGVVMHWLHSPVTAAVLCGFVALLLIGTGETKRRRNRRGNRGHASARQKVSPVTSPERGAPVGVSVRSALIAVAIVAVVCAAVAVFAKTRPTATRVIDTVHYTPEGSHHLPRDGAHRAGVPHRDGRHRRSHLPPTRPPARRQGRLPLCRRRARAGARHPAGVPPADGPTGWTRQIALSPMRHFTGSRDQHPGHDRPARGPGAPGSGPEGHGHPGHGGEHRHRHEGARHRHGRRPAGG